MLHTQLPLVERDSQPAPQAAKKKKNKTGQVKVAGAGLKGFVNLMDSTVSKSTKDREVEMPSLSTGFAEWMRKRVANAQGETTLGSEGPLGKML